jgi:hypothetical protein
MKARALFDGASYGPDALKAMGQAFDEAWTSIAGNFGNDPHDIERARLRLANALLSVASEDSRDVEALKRGALQELALSYRERPTLTPTASLLVAREASDDPAERPHHDVEQGRDDQPTQSSTGR